jgi:hypothetical protein
MNNTNGILIFAGIFALAWSAVGRSNMPHGAKMLLVFLLLALAYFVLGGHR